MKSTLLKILVSICSTVPLAFAQGSAHHVSANVPVIGPRVALGGDRSAADSGSAKLDLHVSPTANNWKLGLCGKPKDRYSLRTEERIV